MPESFICDELAVVGNRDRRARESALLNAGAQNVKGAMKLFVLVVKGRRQNVVDTLVQKMSSYCFCFRFITHSIQR